MKKSPIACLMAITMLLTGCAGSGNSTNSTTTTDIAGTAASVSSTAAAVSSALTSAVEGAASSIATLADNTDVTASAVQPAANTTVVTGAQQPTTIQYMVRPNLLAAHYTPVQYAAKPAQNYLTPDTDLSNVYFGRYGKHMEFGSEYDPMNESYYDALKKNGFYLSESANYEFFELYENNRYELKANYVTVDSMMHTYHLYFQHLLKSIEKDQLSKQLTECSKLMMKNAQAQYNDLKGSEWEDAAKKALAFFTVGSSLLDSKTQVPDVVANEVKAELALINSAEKITASPIFDKNDDYMEDYSQYKPRGYYDETEQLKRYFRAMMWYGRIGMHSDREDLVRTGLLMTMALNGDTLQKWSSIYTVTSFFAGTSDDLGYYEFKPVIDAIYGKDATVKNLIGDTARWTQFKKVCDTLPAPQINSVPCYEDEADESAAAKQKGFRFMGQRFTLDAAAFTKLVYRQVKENADGQKRLLPDALDFPAALGNETALQILKDEGKTNYPNYMENLEKVRTDIKNAPESTWNASLYSSWIYTLLPSIEKKDASYPPFMRTEAWNKKALNTFEGSYTELKHDTVLYAKQVMGEMGGGSDDTKYDDRGYVEAEPAVFGRLKALVKATSEGLSDYNMISAKDKENLGILADLAGKLETIANKELAKQLPTDEEFDLIRCYGGQLEHFWEDVMKADFPDEEVITPQLHPAALVTDIATDPNGTCLQVATGMPIEIGVIVEVDGQLKLATGSVYSFYQFEQPISNRMTDSDWQYRQGIKYDDTYTGDWEKYNEYMEQKYGKKVDEPKWMSDLYAGRG